MRAWIVSGLLCFSGTASALTLEEFAAIAKTRCAPAAANEPVVMGSDFRFGMKQDEMLKLAADLYDSGKRLKARAFYAPDRDVFRMEASDWDRSVVDLPTPLAYAVMRHLEEALRLEYAQVVTFTDMGHAHFFVPLEAWNERIVPAPQGTRAETYAALFREPELKVLYHTAEQLKMTSDDGQLLGDHFLRWRYYTRNLIGETKPQGRLEIHKQLKEGFNTVHELAGHHKYGAGFYINASKDGCFPFLHEGKTRYFDLSLQSLPNPAGDGF